MMKRIPLITTLCFTLLFSYTASAQSASYKEMMYDYSYNFYEVVDSAMAYFEIHGTGKGSGWKGFERWRNETESRYAPSGDRQSIDHSIATKTYTEVRGEMREKTKTSFPNGWEELGPWDANNVTSHYSPGIGRVETFWVNPADANHIYMGSRSGGFWKTTDGGATWQNSTDYLVTCGVTTLDVNPNNPAEVLIGIAQGGNTNTHGVYRSIDSGSTWTVTNFNPQKLNWGGLGDNRRIYKIAYHPTVANKVYIGTSAGLYISDDNLATNWRSDPQFAHDIAFHPTSANVVYLYSGSGSYKNVVRISTNGGNSFNSSAALNGNNNARLYLSTSPAAPNHIYAASNNYIYKSANNGAFFLQLSNPDEACYGGFAVSDRNVDSMIYGYVDLFSSTDGGSSFTKKTRWSVQDEAYIHADLRAAKCVNGVFYVGTDGYLAKSEDNGNTWTTLNDGTAIREFYAVGLSQGDYNVNMAGSQDNGTSILNSDGWIEWNGGDGMEALVHPLNTKWMIGSWQYGTRNYTRDGGMRRNSAGNPQGGSQQAAWEAPLLLNPLNDMVVYHFSDSLLKGNQFGTQWSYAGYPNIGNVAEAAIAETDSNVIVCSRGNNLRLTKDGGQTWSNIRGTLPGRTITDIAISPLDPKVIVVTYNHWSDEPKIFISRDQGSTWQNITHNLSKMPIRTVVIDHTSDEYIYIGGEIGVYYKNKNETTWTLYDNNLPNVTVKDLEIHYGSNTLRAASWGRGLWECTLVGRNDYPDIHTTYLSTTPNKYAPRENIDQYIYATVNSATPISAVKAYWSLNNQSLNNEIAIENESGNIWKIKTPINQGSIGDFVYFKVEATNSAGTSESYTFNYTLKDDVYCESFGALGTGSNFINSVKLNDQQVSSGQDYYGDFTQSNSFSLEAGQTYTLEVSLASAFPQDSVIAWVDFNQDLGFSADEAIIMSSFSNNKATGILAVPSDAPLETELRMRVKSVYNSPVIESCGSDEYGEVEDHTIIVSELPNAIVPTQKIEASITPNPSSEFFEVHLDQAYTETHITVLDIQGKIVLDIAADRKQNINIPHELKTGNYIVNIVTNTGSFSQKLVVE